MSQPPQEGGPGGVDWLRTPVLRQGQEGPRVDLELLSGREVVRNACTY